MKRRDLFKMVAGIPLVGAVVAGTQIEAEAPPVPIPTQEHNFHISWSIAGEAGPELIDMKNLAREITRIQSRRG